MAQKLDLVRTVEVSDIESEVCRVVVEKKSWAKAWCCELLHCAAYNVKPERHWLSSPDRDCLSRAGNGYLTYELPSPGIYQANSVWRPMADHTITFEVTEDQRIVVLSEDEALAKLGYDKERIIEEKRQAALEKAKAREHLPALDGTEKQVKWALDIRDQYIAWAQDHGLSNKLVLEVRSAKIWIERRDPKHWRSAHAEELEAIKRLAEVDKAVDNVVSSPDTTDTEIDALSAKIKDLERRLAEAMRDK